MSALEESKEQLTVHTSLASPPATASSGQPPSSATASAFSPPSDLQIRPPYPLMFKPRQVEALMSAYISDFLSPKSYDPAETSNWAKELAAGLKNRLKELRLPRYKYLVQVIIGENKGAGVRCGARCFWDQTTDKVAQTHFTNDSLFCVVAAFGVYLY